MRKIILTLVASLLCISALADSKSKALLTALEQKMATWGDYRVEFTVSVDGQSLAGSYEVSGENYHMLTPDVELFCDGGVKWEVNLTDREVAIDRVDPTDRTVMGNPTRLFDFLDGSYSHRYVGPALVEGAACERIELTDNALTTRGGSRVGTETTGGPGQKIDVFLSAATGLPVRVGYTIGFMSTEARVDVVRITPRVKIDGTFKYDSKRYPGYEIIDFR